VKVLLVRFSSAGDVLISGELIKRLKKAGHAVHFLTKDKFREAAKAAGAERVFAPVLDGPADYTAAAAILSAENYGAIVDLHGNFRSTVMAALIKAGKKAFYSKNTLRRRLMAAFKWFLGGKITSISRQYINTAAKAIKGIDKSAGITRGKKIKSIIVHTGAKWPLKRWPYFEELARGLAKLKGIKVTVTGVKDEVENYREMVYHKNSNIRDLTGKTSFKQLLAEIRKAGLFIGNDTAAAHAARLYGVPAIILLGPTVQDFGFITAGDFKVIEDPGLLCRPCHVHGGKKCPTGGFECMRKISAAAVVEAVKKIIKREKAGKNG
jgi:ADP-heptose:LPS heptosyltransferase